MATTTIGSRQFTDSSFNHGLGHVRLFQHTLTLEQDNSTGALTLALNGAAVTAVQPNADPSLVTVTAGSQSVNIAVGEFHQLVTKPVGVASGQNPPPNRQLGPAWQGWALARLIQAGVSIDTALRIGARFLG